MVEFIKDTGNLENLKNRVQETTQNALNRIRNRTTGEMDVQNILPLGILPLALGFLVIGSLFLLGRRRNLGLSGETLWNQITGRLGNLTAQDLMSERPVFCRRHTSLHEVASMMVDHHCGEIPVVDESRRPIGVITDRDITCRTVAKGQNPLNIQAERIMTTPIITVHISDSAEKCINLIKEHQIRRLPVVDRNGFLCGIISQADLVKCLEEEESGRLLQRISEPTSTASKISAA